MSKTDVIAWAKGLMERRDFLIVDVETTGFKEYDEILQVTIMNAWGKVCFSSLVKPLRPIDEAGSAFATNGISEAMVQNAPTFPSVYKWVWQWLTDKTVVAYNAEFDKKMLRQCSGFVNRPALECNWQCAMLKYSEFDGTPGKYAGEFKWHKLSDAIATMTDRHYEFHDAGADCRATYDLIEAMAEQKETTK